MTRTTLFAGMLLLSAGCALAAAPKNVPDSAIAEVIRRGDLVTLAGDGLHGATTDPFVRVMAVPEDDSHKWFISIVTSPGCQACESLKAAWKTSPHLLAFARPDDAKESWAHWGVYRSDDATQSWRWKNLRISAYPTILIQPPRNRQYGDPATVVMQRTGYDGDPRKLARDMSAAIRRYVEKVSQSVPAQPDSITGNRQAAADGQTVSDEAPPFSTTSADADELPPGAYVPRDPVVIPPASASTFPPDSDPSLLESLGDVLASRSMPSVLLIVLIGVQIWRAFRRAAKQPLLLDDDSFERLRQLIVEPHGTARHRGERANGPAEADSA